MSGSGFATVPGLQRTTPHVAFTRCAALNCLPAKSDISDLRCAALRPGHVRKGGTRALYTRRHARAPVLGLDPRMTRASMMSFSKRDASLSLLDCFMVAGSSPAITVEGLYGSDPAMTAERTSATVSLWEAGSTPAVEWSIDQEVAPPRCFARHFGPGPRI
jgi:hypothetical protein